MVHGPQDPSLKSVQAPGSSTRMLEAQVAERTSELRAANEHLEAVNAQLIAEINQRQRLETAERIRSQEMAVADEVARILTSTLHPDQVYDGFGNEVKKLVDYDWFSIRVIDHDAECYTIRNRSGTENPSRQVGAVVPLKGTQTGKMIETQESIIQFDFKDDVRFPGDQIFFMEGFRSSALIPLISKGRVIGSMHLRSRGVNTYGEREQAILERLAKQIAPAVENALLYEQTVQDQEERAVADKVAQIITSTLDIDEVCEEFTVAMKTLIEIDQASINIINQGTTTYTKKYLFGQPRPEQKVGMVLPLANTRTEYVFKTGQTIVRGDFYSELRFIHDAEYQELALRSSIALPLASKGRIIGSWVLRSRAANAYGEREQTILERLAKQIAPAVENALLYEQTVQDQKELRKLSQAVEQSPSTVIITNTQNSIQYVNPKFTEVTGYTPEEAVGQTSKLLESGQTSRKELAQMWETIASGKEWHGECLKRKKNGETYWASESIAPILDSQGEITHIVTLGEDITERKLLQEQLNQSQKMESIGQLAGGVAHDFNNLLTVITGYTSMLLSKNPAESENTDQLREISKAAELGSQLTNQLLGFSSRQVIKPKSLDVSTAVRNSYGMLRRVIGENIELVMSSADGLPAVFMDPAQLDQILMNLVVNARDAMPEGGTLTIAACHNQGELSAADIGDCVVLSVSDTGVGVSEEVKAHLFEPFFTTKEKGKGSGLGLATCFGIVEQNGGLIEVHSELGQGSTFKVYLPVTEEREGSELDAGTSAVSSSTPGTETILLVEDEPQVRAMEAIILADQGYAVLQAADGEEALLVCQENQDQEIHLLVTDMVMPRMSGGELITEVSSKRPETKFLVVSGYAEGAIERSAVTRGDVHFMQKPFKPMELANAVRAILDGVAEPSV